MFNRKRIERLESIVYRQYEVLKHLSEMVLDLELQSETHKKLYDEDKSFLKVRLNEIEEKSDGT